VSKLEVQIHEIIS